MNRKQYLAVSLIAFLIVLTWIISDIFHQRAQVKVEPELQEALESLSPTFDNQMLDLVSKIPSP